MKLIKFVNLRTLYVTSCLLSVLTEFYQYLAVYIFPAFGSNFSLKRTGSSTKGSAVRHEYYTADT